MLKRFNMLYESLMESSNNDNKELFKAIEDDNIQKVQELIDKGVDVNFNSLLNGIALINASRYGREKVVELLLKVKDININRKDEYASTALIWASNNGNIKVVELLLKQKGIDVNVKDIFDETALTLASRHGYENIVKLLKAHGAK